MMARSVDTLQKPSSAIDPEQYPIKDKLNGNTTLPQTQSMLMTDESAKGWGLRFRV